MIFEYEVKHNGVNYIPGMDVPIEEEVKDEKPTTKKRGKKVEETTEE